MTYQLMASLLAGRGVRGALGAVTGKADGIFYAQILLRGGAKGGRPAERRGQPGGITGASVLVASDLLDLPASPRQPAA